MRDIASLVELGARHITFGDPDFLNGRRHSLRVVQAMHERFPELTFDCTTKVEHILRDAELWPALAGAGCLFVVSAFESVNDEILERLDKGHTTEEAERAIALLREHGIEVLVPVYGQIKYNRRVDRFMRRGRAAAQSKWRLVTATHNMLKLHSHWIANTA